MSIRKAITAIAAVIVTILTLTAAPTYIRAETTAKTYTEQDIEYLSKMVYGEARGCPPEEQRLVVWTVLQRVDSEEEYWADTIIEVITAKNQFAGYNKKNPVEAEISALCAEELEKWINGGEAPMHEIYAPTAPYYFFQGDNEREHNYFRKDWR